MTADIIIKNARVHCMGESFGLAEAIAVKADRIIAVGQNDEMSDLASPETQVIDAQNASVLPGFVESHMHLFLGAFSRTVLQIGNHGGADFITNAIREFAAREADAPLLIVQGVPYDCLEGRNPDRFALDAILPDRPLLLQSADIHNGWANTAALKAADILNGRELPIGSEIVLDADGVATGELREPPAVAAVLAKGAHGGREGLGLEGLEPHLPPTAEQREADKALLRNGMAHCAAHGITTIINMDGNLYQAGLLAEIEQEGGLTCRVELPYHFIPGENPANIEIAEKMRALLASDMLWCNRIKMFMDGVLDMHTGARLSDYPDHPGVKGELLHDPEVFNTLVQGFDRRGFQISVHAIGDRAVQATIDGYEAARTVNGPRDSRHRIEHIELIDPVDVPRLAEFGIVASIQPPHPPGCEFPMEPTRSIIGEDQLPNAHLWRSLAEAGAAICYSSDWPVASLSPITGIRYARQRLPWTVDGHDERLDLDATLAAYTSGGAYAAHRENSFGRLKVGMKADLVMLNTSVTDLTLNECAPVLTICDGKITYCDKDAMLPAPAAGS